MSSLPKLLKLKDYVTLIGTTMGVIAVCCAVIGDRFFLSLGFFLVTAAVGTDLADGFIARKTGTVNELGKELDSLNDSLCFGIAPAILTFQAFRTGAAYDFLLLIGCVCFALGGILRLARFNIQEDKTYTGLATPMSGLFLINIFYAHYFYAIATSGGDMNASFPITSYYLMPFILIFIGWLNITTYIYYGEKDKIVYILFCCFAPLAPILGILGLLLESFGSSMIMVAIVISICFIGFVIAESGMIVLGFYNKQKSKK